MQVVFSKLGSISSAIDESSFRISGKSIDARDKKNIRIIYNVDFTIKTSGNKNSEEQFITKIQNKNRKIKIKIISDKEYNPIIQVPNEDSLRSYGNTNETNRPVIVGFGPAGMFAAIHLLKNGINPIIIERGKKVEDRVKDVNRFWNEGVFNPNSNPLFGEGGAGTFSDGKLTTGKNDPRIPFILKTFYEAGAPKEILYAKNPHIGTDVLRRVVKTMREKMIEDGADIKFDTTFVGFETKESVINTVKIRDNVSGEEEIIETNHLILAIGHSARDTYKVLYEQGLGMEQKPFSIGVRIEHKQSMIDRSQYGAKFEEYYGLSLEKAGMPPAEYKLSHRTQSGRGVYTFCMCPGGQVITTSAEEGTISVNGMSEQKRDKEKANSALLVDVRTDDYINDEPLAGVEFQREYERRAFVAGGSNYEAPVETVAQFMSDASMLAGCLPDFAVEGIREGLPVFGRKIRGFDNPDAIIKGIESGSSSPVRITRDKELVSNVKGIYPCGEGAGYAGGITSAAIDGLKCAEKVIEQIKTSV